MNETSDLVMYCRELRLLTTFWWGCALAGGIAAIAYGCLYHFGVRFRIPRMRSTMRRLAKERDQAKAEAIRNGVECETLRRAMETVGREAEKEIKAADAKVDRERAIRKRTEDKLTERTALLEDSQSQCKTLEGLLLAVNGHLTIEPGSPESWIPAQFPGKESATK